MKVQFVSLAALCVLLAGCISGKIINGDGNLVTKTISISDYSDIEASGSSMKINYAQSEDAPFLEITTDGNIYEKYDFTVDKGRALKILPKKEFRNFHIFRPTRFTVTTRSTRLHKVELSGNGDFITDSPLKTEDLSFELAGNGNIHLNKEVNAGKVKVDMAGSATFQAVALTCESMDGDIAGSGTLNLAGSTRKADIDIAGSGDVHGFDFVTDELRCDIAGSGNIEIYVNKSIRANIAGSGKIRYKGDPAEIIPEVTGSGSVKKAD
jgi:hypothetical protein